MTEVATVPARTQDAAWFADQVQALLPRLYGTAVRLCGQRADAEDLVAEATTKAWQKLESLKNPDAFGGWLFQILTNTYVSQYRARKSQPEIDSIGADAADFSLFERLHQPILLWWGNPEQEFLNDLLRDDLRSAVDGLAEPFRTVVVLVDVQGLAYGEVAATLGVPVGTVRSRLARGRSLLQRDLWQDARDAGLGKGRVPEGEDR